MIKGVITIIILLLALSTYAEENIQTNEDNNQNLEQKKSEMLKRFDERIEKLQQGKSCIQEAKSADEVNACWNKFMPKRKGKNRIQQNYNKNNYNIIDNQRITEAQ
ncbi:MAG: hypothetical protein HQK79_14015 [Desulfobacterales bacterium]|nr:hypothetical protein [Desulfobacterales bacterium]